ncbi:MFS general substrate transporter [Didymella exigua CBS 183.55]|uniref:MFS general substrate transporter n=1 Tax=Didymella exigua CBS 183.55 TaxID=1150837 RepID=A0A6A5RXL2_9PLEO|nr:MFS general substrate transporter [Didymella exigua CBS 183.55]KAF1932582.1 MFS general substrate transporter [Didymella exigua CBS 183.55]
MGSRAFDKKGLGGDNTIILEPNSSPEWTEIDSEDNIPPRDRGKAAWRCLAAISAISMVTWGFGATQGVFREYYFKNPPFEGNQLVASIGLLIVGILQSLSPFLLHLIGKYPSCRLYMMWTGMTLVVASSLGAAFSITALQVIMTQGLMYGFSSGLLFAPCISFVDEWFFARRGLANGIFFGSANIASAALSPIFAHLLQRFGPRVTLIGWTAFIAIVISIGIPCIPNRSSRTAQSDNGTQKRRSTLRPFKNPYLWLFVASMAVQSLANNLPANYLPSYATDLGVESSKAALLVTYLSLSGIIGQVVFGALTDAIGPLVPMLLSTLVSSFAVLVVWGFGKAYWTMVMVSLLFGAFAFSFMVLRSHMAAIVVNDSKRPAEELLVSGVLLFTRGVVGVASGYIAAAVLDKSGDAEVQPGYGAGKWRNFIILLGTTMAAATVGVFGLVKRRPRK